MALFARTETMPGVAMPHHSLITWERGHVRGAVPKLEDGTAELLGVAAAPVHGIGGSSLPDLDRWHAGAERALFRAVLPLRSSFRPPPPPPKTHPPQPQRRRQSQRALFRRDLQRFIVRVVGHVRHLGSVKIFRPPVRRIFDNKRPQPMPDNWPRTS